MPARTLTLYSDYKSPYAYLAKEPAYRLEQETGVAIGRASCRERVCHNV